jgi:hypothetical protein
VPTVLGYRDNKDNLFFLDVHCVRLQQTVVVPISLQSIIKYVELAECHSKLPCVVFCVKVKETRNISETFTLLLISADNEFYSQKYFCHAPE